jgi:hypothetical protein
MVHTWPVVAAILRKRRFVSMHPMHNSRLIRSLPGHTHTNTDKQTHTQRDTQRDTHVRTYIYTVLFTTYTSQTIVPNYI